MQTSNLNNKKNYVCTFYFHISGFKNAQVFTAVITARTDAFAPAILAALLWDFA